MKKYVFVIFTILIIALLIYYTRYYGCTERTEITEPKTEISGAPETYTGKLRLASWNIRIFSNDSRDNYKLGKICNILKNYDFVAIIELKDEPVLIRTRDLLKTMGKEYGYEISEEVGRGVKERYAFIYDMSKVKKIKPGKIFQDPKDELIREPFYGTFKSGNFDFTIIVTHIVWGDKVKERRKEVQKLAEVYNNIQNADQSEQDVILVGDFNREPNDYKAFGKLREIHSMINLFSLPQKTVIYDSSLYDNIWFQSKYLKEYTGNSGIDHFDETDFGNDDAMASIIVSDHRPVWAEFDTRFDDD